MRIILHNPYGNRQSAIGNSALRPVLDVVVRVRQREAVEREVRGDGVDELPALEELRRVAAGGDDVGPVAQGGGVVFGELLDHAADAVEDAVQDRVAGGDA